MEVLILGVVLPSYIVGTWFSIVKWVGLFQVRAWSARAIADCMQLGSTALRIRQTDGCRLHGGHATHLVGACRLSRPAVSQVARR